MVPQPISDHIFIYNSVLSSMGLLVIAFGTGGIKPCVILS